MIDRDAARRRAAQAPLTRWFVLAAAGWLVHCASPSELGANPDAPSSEEVAPNPSRVVYRARPRSVGLAADGLLFLASPLDREQALDVVRRLFAAIVAESLDELRGLCRENAPLRARDPNRSQAIVQAWKQRFQALDYTSIDLHRLYRPGAVEIYSKQDLEQLAPQRSFALSPDDGELLVETRPTPTEAIGGAPPPFQRLFGSKISLLVEPTASGFVIAEMAEDFELR